MATDSIRKQILALFQTTLETISIANGYRTNVQKVERASQRPLQAGVYPAISVVEDQETKGMSLMRGAASGVPAPLGKMGADLPLTIAFVLQTTLDNASDLVDDLFTDIEICIMTLDEYVLPNGERLELIVHGQRPIITEAVAPFAAGEFYLTVNYSYMRGDPTRP